MTLLRKKTDHELIHHFRDGDLHALEALIVRRDRERKDAAGAASPDADETLSTCLDEVAAERSQSPVTAEDAMIG